MVLEFDGVHDFDSLYRQIVVKESIRGKQVSFDPLSLEMAIKVFLPHVDFDVSIKKPDSNTYRYVDFATIDSKFHKCRPSDVQLALKYIGINSYIVTRSIEVRDTSYDVIFTILYSDDI